MSFEFNESELDTDSDEERYEIVTHDKNQQELFQTGKHTESESEIDYSDDDSDLSQSQSQIIENEQELNEVIKRTKLDKDTIVEKLARMLVVFSKIMQSNHVFRDMF